MTQDLDNTTDEQESLNEMIDRVTWMNKEQKELTKKKFASIQEKNKNELHSFTHNDKELMKRSN